ncbi:tellurite resistance protein, partial [gut metagenome]
MMDENLKLPELRFDTDSVPTLTLDPEGDEKALQNKAQKEETIEPIKVEETPLTPEEQQVVDAFVEKIDVTNSQMVLQYGAAAQKKIGAFSESALEKVRTQDLGATGEMIASLVSELEGFEAAEKPKGFFGMFKKAKTSVDILKARYAEVEANVNKI